MHALRSAKSGKGTEGMIPGCLLSWKQMDPVRWWTQTLLVQGQISMPTAVQCLFWTHIYLYSDSYLWAIFSTFLVFWVSSKRLSAFPNDRDRIFATRLDPFLQTPWKMLANVRKSATGCMDRTWEHFQVSLFPGQSKDVKRSKRNGHKVTLRNADSAKYSHDVYPHSAMTFHAVSYPPAGKNAGIIQVGGLPAAEQSGCVLDYHWVTFSQVTQVSLRPIHTKRQRQHNVGPA